MTMTPPNKDPIELAAEKYAGYGDSYDSEIYEAYIAGAQFQQAVILEQQALLDECESVLEDMKYWLNRMKDLKWEDPEYAPRFKKGALRSFELLSKLRERKGE